ncbi:trypsin-like peptidase domain-containing protein [Staphylococcus pseudintermedius]|uniref:Serine protease n=4 Tax=Staphylococcus pseudintermedius TaxID=283734 RepID=A0A8H9BVH1_STAPS|nr:trypsin-like peptidase domain-containing protein [Staphylococcus pseudintermedius]ADV04826.1 probable glutamyl-endopeptidase [Staphylococcus pseudintermedius HKU10-03]EGQ0306852.1 trypsin-like serine protease [Staphylococcus pseudintermedius]EGQ0318518.1 trypsin-like serine protease [Staphylococcus pseudintermedius]EGQ0379167.1 trypsin-like serine protease [Staphylococcus pseudintermedius]EGQ0381499.1 trypsin-like serine protease [Staphylococcus pseudintermedius]
MKKLCLILLMTFSLIPFPLSNTTFAKGKQTPITDTVADRHSIYSALYKTANGRFCTAILISSTAALTARHCVGREPAERVGTIYPGQNGDKRPFGYMNIRTYIPNPNPKYDIAILKGTERDQDEFYKYYIRKFSTTVKGYTDEEFRAFMGQDAYAYGYPHGKQFRNNVQYRSDGKITSYKTKPIPYLLTDMPAFSGQSGSGVFKKDGKFLGIMVTRTKKNTANILPFTESIAKWINENAK